MTGCIKWWLLSLDCCALKHIICVLECQVMLHKFCAVCVNALNQCSIMHVTHVLCDGYDHDLLDHDHVGIV